MELQIEGLSTWISCCEHFPHNLDIPEYVVYTFEIADPFFLAHNSKN